MTVNKRSFLISIMIFETLAVGVAIALGTYLGNPAKLFGEHMPITWISVFQLACHVWAVIYDPVYPWF